MTNTTTLSTSQQFFFLRLCVWAGPIYLIGSLVAWALVAGFVPPPRADWTTAQVAQFYYDNSARIRLGMVLTLFFQPLWVVMSIAIYRVMQKVEGQGGTLSLVQLFASVLNWAIIAGALVLWLTAAFRPESRTPQEIMLLNDLGWMLIDTPIMGTSLQLVSFGVLFLADRRATPLIPRWLCWLSFFITLTFVSDMAIPFFHHGPLSWQGLISFWVVYPLYFFWVIPVCVCLFKAVKRLEQEAQA